MPQAELWDAAFYRALPTDPLGPLRRLAPKLRGDEACLPLAHIASRLALISHAAWPEPYPEGEPVATGELSAESVAGCLSDAAGGPLKACGALLEALEGHELRQRADAMCFAMEVGAKCLSRAWREVGEDGQHEVHDVARRFLVDFAYPLGEIHESTRKGIISEFESLCHSPFPL